MIRDSNQTNKFSTNFPGHNVAAITVAQEIRNLKFKTKEISETVERNKSHPSPEGTHPSPEGTHQGYCKSGLAPQSRRDTQG